MAHQVYNPISALNGDQRFVFLFSHHRLLMSIPRSLQNGFSPQKLFCTNLRGWRWEKDACRRRIECWRGGNMMIELHYGDARVWLVNANWQVGREDHSDRRSLMRTFRWLDHSFDGFHSTSVLWFADDENRSVFTKHRWTLPSLFVAKQIHFHGETSVFVSFALRFDQRRRWDFGVMSLRSRAKGTYFDVRRRCHGFAVLQRFDVDHEWLPGEIEARNEHEERVNESRDEDSEIVRRETEETTQFEDDGHSGDHCQ